MDMQSFLDDLIKTGREYAEQGQKMAEEKLNIDTEGDTRDATLDGMKKGALAAGALAILLGTRSGRKFTGSAIKIGSLAAVGGIAWKTLQKWADEQTQNATSTQAQTKTGTDQPEVIEAKPIETSMETSVETTIEPKTDAEVEPDLGNQTKTGADANNTTKVEPQVETSVEPPKKLSIDKLEGKEAEERSQILVKAMIAAAKCDGRMSEDETNTVNQQIKKLGLGENIESVIKAGMVTPLSAKSVAKMADDTEVAAEIYVVSMLVTNIENDQEKKYMHSLAQALELPETVILELESYRA